MYPGAMVLLVVITAVFIKGVSGHTVLHAHHSAHTDARGGAGQKTEGSVIQKVIEMLQENKVKVVEDLKQEEQEMKEYNEFCDTELDSLAYAVKIATRKISDLSAQIDDAAAQIVSLDDEIALTGRELASKDSEMADAKMVRKKDRTNFESVEKEMLVSVEAVEKAIVLVKRSSSFLEIQKGGKPSSHKARIFARNLATTLGPIINAAWVDKGSKTILDGFLQDRNEAAEKEDDDLELKAPAAKKEASGGILQTLEDMKEKAEETLSSARMEEMKANHNHEMMMASLDSAMTLMKKKISEAKATKAALTETKGKAEGEISTAKKTKVSDSFTADRLKGECEIAQTEWVEKQKTAKGEIAALDKAKEILTDRVKVLLSTDEPYESQGSAPDDRQEAAQRHRLIDKLQTLGHKFGSYAMMEMAAAAAQDPFAKIKGLVEEMIAKLVAAAQEEATQKDFCDQEKAKSVKEQEAKSLRFDDLKSRLDSATTMKAQLEEQIKELHSEIAEIDKAVEEASAIRAENHATFAKSKKDFTEGAAAVEEAIRVLKEFYASQSASLIQKARKGRPAFGGIQNDAASAIIAILENSAQEFSRMLTEVEQEEAEYVAKFKERDESLKASKKSKQDEIQSTESEIKVISVQIEGDSEDIKMVTKELDAVMEYLDKLKPQCETKAMTYEEKKAKREAEIEGLKEALAILDAPSLVQSSNHNMISRH